MEKRELTVSELVNQLNQFADQRFPIDEVDSFLRQLSLPRHELEPYTFFDSDQYTRNLIHKSEEFELLAICWQPGQDSPVHGHEGEKCWSRVEMGKLRFTNYLAVPSGDFFNFEILSVNVGNPGHLDGPADIHKVENAFDEPAVSLHLYSYPFEACDIYDLENHCTNRKTLGYFSKFGRRCQ
ncbi:cysteine dioxygenase family protein [Acidobacteria bacterium AH-259-D05]|nr:cysteine dioxygenase family protein [Acidobacteria bacterium AH-259-D05]